MITLEINGKEFNIASSYEELSLGQYIDIIKQGESKQQLEATDSDIKMICLLSDNPSELEPLLWDFSVEEFKELTNEFNWVADTSLLEDLKKLKPLDKIIIDEKEYVIISNYNKLSLGEVISFETILKQEQSDFHKLDIAFGVLLRPVEDGKPVKFTEETFLEVIKNKYKVKMVDLYAVISFFLSGEKMSTTENTKRFSIRKK